MGSARSKRTIAVTGLLGVFLVLLFITTLNSHDSISAAVPSRSSKSRMSEDLGLHDADLKGPTIMPKLGNATAKAELGRAAWKLLHTTMARFPDEPTKEESAALKAYMHLFQRLYPCGECADHFGKIITKYPPQVASRPTAAAWACFVHNEVNKSLDKPIFDCSNIGDFYDCGCADDEKAEKGLKSSKGSKESKKGAKSTMDEDEKLSPNDRKPEMSLSAKEKITGELGREFNEDLLPPKLKEEGYGRGG